MKSYNDYFYENTHTLKNKLGITDSNELQEAERFFSALRMRESIGKVELNGDGLQRVHQHIFQDLYPWAGKFRTVDMVKMVPNEPPVEFARASRIADTEIPRLFGRLNEDLNVNQTFDNLDPKTFGQRAAGYIADLNYIHPFPEGNGRTQRFLLGELAQRAGYQLDVTKLDRDQFIAGARDSYKQDYDGPHKVMSEVIANAVTPIQQQNVTVPAAAVSVVAAPKKGDIGEQFINADEQTRLADPRLRNAQLQLEVGLRMVESATGRKIDEIPDITAKLTKAVGEQLSAGKVFEAPQVKPDQGEAAPPRVTPPTQKAEGAVAAGVASIWIADVLR